MTGQPASIVHLWRLRISSQLPRYYARRLNTRMPSEAAHLAQNRPAQGLLSRFPALSGRFRLRWLNVVGQGQPDTPIYTLMDTDILVRF
jgi:hypothetical protein